MFQVRGRPFTVTVGKLGSGIFRRRESSQSDTTAKALACSKTILEIQDFNSKLAPYIVYPANRHREVTKLLETCLENWSVTTSKPFLPFAPQAQGTGKTFLGTNLPHFLNKTEAENDFPFAPIATERMKNIAPELFDTEVIAVRPKKTVLSDILDQQNLSSAGIQLLDKFRTVRPITLEVGNLLPEAGSLERAMMISVLAVIRGSYSRLSFLDELAAADILSFYDLCKVLLQANGGAAVIILDDFTGLIGSSKRKLFDNVDDKETPDEKTVIGAIKDIVTNCLRMPGMILYMTGRAPHAVYRQFETVDASPLRVEPIMLDALTIKDIIDVLYRSRPDQRGTFSERLGLRNNLDVQDMACILHWYTGGLGRAVEDTIRALVGSRVSGAMLGRGKGERVASILTCDYMDRIFTKHIKVNKSLLPRWSRVLPSWDPETAARALLNVLREGLKGTLLNMDTEVDVGTPSQEVRMEDFLSIMSVPFVVVDEVHLRVQVSPWVVSALSITVPILSEDNRKELAAIAEELKSTTREYFLQCLRKRLVSN